jgi:hypothetical protein
MLRMIYGFPTISPVFSNLVITGSAYMISPQFPRVAVHLRPEYLEVTPARKKALEDLVATPDIGTLHSFTETFGNIYASAIELGGRLQCT